MQAPASASALLLTSSPLFARSAEVDALRSSPWRLAAAVFHVAQTRAHELDEAAGARGAELLALGLATSGTAAPASGAPASVQLQTAFEHVLEALGRVSTQPSNAKGVVAAMPASLTTLVQASICKGGALADAAADALATHVARGGTDYESLCPSLLVAGAPSAGELTRLLMRERAPPSRGGPSAPLAMLAALEHILKTGTEHKSRLSAIACCQRLWDLAVTKCAMLKVRDRDKQVRALGLKVCAAIGGEAIAAHLSAQQLQQLVLHGRSGDAPADAAAMVSEAFWAFLIARQDRVCDVLAELRATEQRELYKPLLMQHIKETYEAVFGSSDEQMDGAGDYDDIEQDL